MRNDMADVLYGYSDYMEVIMHDIREELKNGEDLNEIINWATEEVRAMYLALETMRRLNTEQEYVKDWSGL